MTLTIWTRTTDGDNCPLTTTAHASREEAEAAVWADLAPEIARHSADGAPAAPLAGEALRLAWAATFDGACSIEAHDIPEARRDDAFRALFDAADAAAEYVERFGELSEAPADSACWSAVEALRKARAEAAPLLSKEAATEAPDPWADDPVYGGGDWRAAVAAGDTRSGYLDWVTAQKDANAEGALWTRSDSAAAVAEGWDIFDHPERGMEIEMIDSATEAFDGDNDAEDFVRRKAKTGSALHRKALAIIEIAKEIEPQEIKPA